MSMLPLACITKNRGLYLCNMKFSYEDRTRRPEARHPSKDKMTIGNRLDASLQKPHHAAMTNFMRA